jgi:signal transduction histidine kinase
MTNQRMGRLLSPITHHIRWRILLSHVTVLFLSLSLTAFALVTMIQRYFISAVERNLEAQAQLLTSAIFARRDVAVPPLPDQAAMNTIQQQQLANLNVQLESNSGGLNGTTDSAWPQELTDLQGIRESTFEITTLIDTHIQVFDRAGKVLIDSHPDDLASEPEHMPLVEQALAGRTFSEQMRLPDQTWIFYTTPLSSNDEIIGALVLSLPLQDVNTVLDDLASRWLFSIAISLPLSILLALVLSNSLTRPIIALTDAVDQLRHGDYEYPLPATGDDEIGELNQAFQSMRDRLRDTERMRSQFISDVSHELRTPLTGIKGLAESLANGAADDPQLRSQFLGSIDREIDRMIRLVNDLMLLSRADSHALAIRPEFTDLREIARSAIEITASVQEQPCVAPVFRSPGVPVPVFVDPDRIEQALINLLDNAYRFTGNEGAIEVQIHVVQVPPPVKARQEPPGALLDERLGAGHWAVVSVIDSGPGIQGADLERVFDRFYRADPSRSRARGGSGLGLSIAKAIIEAHQGTIWIESPPRLPGPDFPSGTMASFSLPLSSQNRPAPR